MQHYYKSCSVLAPTSFIYIQTLPGNLCGKMFVLGKWRDTSPKTNLSTGNTKKRILELVYNNNKKKPGATNFVPADVGK